MGAEEVFVVNAFLTGFQVGAEALDHLQKRRCDRPLRPGELGFAANYLHAFKIPQKQGVVPGGGVHDGTVGEKPQGGYGAAAFPNGLSEQLHGVACGQHHGSSFNGIPQRVLIGGETAQSQLQHGIRHCPQIDHGNVVRGKPGHLIPGGAYKLRLRQTGLKVSQVSLFTVEAAKLRIQGFYGHGFTASPERMFALI